MYFENISSKKNTKYDGIFENTSFVKIESSKWTRYYGKH
jgi:hypothetical protein